MVNIAAIGIARLPYFTTTKKACFFPKIPFSEDENMSGWVFSEIPEDLNSLSYFSFRKQYKHVLLSWQYAIRFFVRMFGLFFCKFSLVPLLSMLTFTTPTAHPTLSLYIGMLLPLFVLFCRFRVLLLTSVCCLSICRILFCSSQIIYIRPYSLNTTTAFCFVSECLTMAVFVRLRACHATTQSYFTWL